METTETKSTNGDPVVALRRQRDIAKKKHAEAEAAHMAAAMALEAAERGAGVNPTDAAVEAVENAEREERRTRLGLSNASRLLTVATEALDDGEGRQLRARHEAARTEAEDGYHTRRADIVAHLIEIRALMAAERRRLLEAIEEQHAAAAVCGVRPVVLEEEVYAIRCALAADRAAKDPAAGHLPDGLHELVNSNA